MVSFQSNESRTLITAIISRLLKDSRYQEALSLLDKMLTRYPDTQEFYCYKGLFLSCLGRLDESILSYEKALQLQPNMLQAVLELAFTYFNNQNYQRSLELTSRSLAIDPSQSNAYFLKGLCLEKENDLEAAVEAYNLCLSIDPSFFDCWVNQANVLFYLKRYQESICSYKKALAIKNDAVIQMNIATCYQNLGDFEKAIISYQQSLASDDNLYMAHFYMGNIYFHLRNYESSLNSYQKCIKIVPDFEEVHLSYAKCLQHVKQFKEAIVSYEYLLNRNPDRKDFYVGYAQCLFETGLFNKSIFFLFKFIEFHPQNYDAYLSLAIAHLYNKQYNQAILYLNKALEINPNFALAKWNKAMCLLLIGKFKEGLELYEYRRDLENLKSDFCYFEYLELDHLDVTDKIVYVYSEQGYGDIIQFSRYVVLLARLGAKIIFGAPYPLKELFLTLNENVTIIDRRDPIPKHDYVVPVGSLPRLFQTTTESIPSFESYLKPDLEKIKFFNRLLGGKKKKRIGFAFAGSQLIDPLRSIPCQDFIKIFSEEFQFVCLQIELSEENQTILQDQGITVYREHIKDFSDTAALISNMDLVITIDTSIAHLSGALGTKTWVLLKEVPDHRWLLDIESSPWYPSVRLYRQKSYNNWDSVLQEVRKELITHFQVN